MDAQGRGHAHYHKAPQHKQKPRQECLRTHHTSAKAFLVAKRERRGATPAWEAEPSRANAHLVLLLRRQGLREPAWACKRVKCWSQRKGTRAQARLPGAHEQSSARGGEREGGRAWRMLQAKQRGYYSQAGLQAAVARLYQLRPLRTQHARGHQPSGSLRTHCRSQTHRCSRETQKSRTCTGSTRWPAGRLGTEASSCASFFAGACTFCRGSVFSPPRPYMGTTCTPQGSRPGVSKEGQAGSEL